MPKTKDLIYTKAFIEKYENDQFTAIASNDLEDRQGEIVSVEGWDLKNFKTDPVILWAHQHEEPAIGNATRIWVDKTGKKPILKFKAFISEASTRAREIKALMQEGIIRAFSVGFRPLDQEDNKFLKQELLEISAVNVPANANALMLAYKTLKKAGFDNKDISKLNIPAEWIEKVSRLEEKQELMEGKLDTAVKGLVSLNPQGRSQRLLEERLAVNKAIVRAADKLMTQPKFKQERLVKAIKLAGEKLIVSQKQELNGKDKRT